MRRQLLYGGDCSVCVCHVRVYKHVKLVTGLKANFKYIFSDT